MKARIDVQNRAEAEMINAGLQDPYLRTLVKVTGALRALPPHQRDRVLEYVNQHIDDIKTDGNAHGDMEMEAAPAPRAQR
jgi:hypothetical protein